MQLSEGASQLLKGLVAAVGAAAYIYVLGAAVLWYRLHDAGLPTEIPVATALRPELVVLGATTLAAWLALSVVVGLAVLAAMRTSREDRWLAVAAAVLGLAIGAAIWVAASRGAAVWAVPALTAALPIGVAAWLRVPVTTLLSLVLPVALGIAAGAGTAALIHDDKASAAGLAWLTFLGAVAAASALRRSWDARRRQLRTVAMWEARRDRLQRQIDAVPAAAAAGATAALLAERTRADTIAERLRTHLGVPGDPGRRTVWAWWRWAAFALLAALFLGGVAMASQHRRHGDFLTASVALDSGRCLEGTYLARDDHRLVLGASAGATTDLTVIPVDSVRLLAVRAPARQVVAETHAVPCSTIERAVAPPSADAGTKTGPQGPPGRDGRDGRDGAPGRDGRDGAAGRDGRDGKPGPRGVTGARGADGPRGARGATGLRGADGPRGARGATGPRGADGPRGARGGTGPRGADGPRGARGPRGKRGPAGPRGPRGPRGARGQAIVVNGRG